MPDPAKPLTPAEVAAFAELASSVAALLKIQVSVDESAVHIYDPDGIYKGSLRLADLDQPNLT